MCTVTYLPLSEDSYILTSNRDEKIFRRRALLPSADFIGEQTILYPKDLQGGGSWIATSADKTLCLLNGAFHPHQPLSTYKHSRGKVVVAAFTYQSFADFVTHYDFRGIEPFTLVAIENYQVYELRWNGIRRFVKSLDPGMPYIWSSITLYNREVRMQRKSWFIDWLLTTDEYSLETIRHFHKTAGDGDLTNSLVMNRNNEIRTVSLTSVIHRQEEVEMMYEDLLLGQVYYVSLHEMELTQC